MPVSPRRLAALRKLQAAAVAARASAHPCSATGVIGPTVLARHLRVMVKQSLLAGVELLVPVDDMRCLDATLTTFLQVELKDSS